MRFVPATMRYSQGLTSRRLRPVNGLGQLLSGRPTASRAGAIPNAQPRGAVHFSWRPYLVSQYITCIVQQTPYAAAGVSSVKRMGAINQKSGGAREKGSGQQ